MLEVHVQHVLHMSHRYVYSSNIATLSYSRSKRNAAAAEEEGAAAAVGLAMLLACLGGAPGSPYQANLLHELASNEECKQTCCCRACWNGLQPC